MMGAVRPLKCRASVLDAGSNSGVDAVFVSGPDVYAGGYNTNSSGVIGQSSAVSSILVSNPY